MDSKESTPPAYVAWWAGTTNLFLLGSQPAKACSKIPALYVHTSEQVPYTQSGNGRFLAYVFSISRWKYQPRLVMVGVHVPNPFHYIYHHVQRSGQICVLCDPWGTVTFFIQTFFIHDKVYTNFLCTGQSLYRTKFIQGQSLYEDKVYTGTKFIRDKVRTVTKFIRGQSLYKLFHTAYLN